MFLGKVCSGVHPQFSMKSAALIDARDSRTSFRSIQLFGISENLEDLVGKRREQNGFTRGNFADCSPYLAPAKT